MNGFALVSLISFIVCILLGVFVYITKVRYIFDNKLAKYFVLICFSLAFFWAIIEFGYRNATSYEGAYFWTKINVLWYFVISFILHFVLILTENKKLLKNKLTYFLIYGPAIIFTVVDIETTLLLTDPIKAEWGWMFGIPENPITYGLSSTWAMCTVVFSLIICLEYIYYGRQSYRRKQIKVSTLGLSIPIIVGFHTEYLFPIINIQVPELVVPSLTIGILVIWYSLFLQEKHQKNQVYEIVKNEIDTIVEKNFYRYDLTERTLKE